MSANVCTIGIIIDLDTFERLGKPPQAVAVLNGDDCLIVPRAGWSFFSVPNHMCLSVSKSHIDTFFKKGVFETEMDNFLGLYMCRVKGCSKEFISGFARPWI